MKITYAKENIKKAITWLEYEYGSEDDMPTFAYEAKLELEAALSQLSGAE